MDCGDVAVCRCDSHEFGKVAVFDFAIEVVKGSDGGDSDVAI
jgi:hypothetical protein